MRIIINIVAGIALLIGIGYLFTAATFTTGMNLSSASAIQITQVYTQAGFNALMGIGALLVAVVLVIAGRPTPQPATVQHVAPNTGAPQTMGGKLGSL